MILSGFFYLKAKTAPLCLKKVMIFLMIFEGFMWCLYTGNELWITCFIYSSLWIVLYLGFCGLFTLNFYSIDMKRVTITFFILYAALFLFNYMTNISLGLNKRALIESYFIITLLPFVILLPKRLRFTLLILSFGFIILASKRTGLITFSAAILTYILLSGEGFSGKLNTFVTSIFLCIVGILAASYIFPEKFNYIIERFSSISEDGGSGRDRAFEVIFNKFLQTNDWDFIIGHGHNMVAVNKINLGYSAHNEFLEMAWDYGIVGLISYILILIYVLSMVNLKYLPKNIRIGLGVSATIMFCLSMTSHLVLFTTYVINLLAFWGYVTAFISKADEVEYNPIS